MHPTVEEVLDKACHLKQFLREELHIREDLALLAFEELWSLQKTFEAIENLVFRIHRGRGRDLEELEENVEKQRKKIDKIVAVMMADYFFSLIPGKLLKKN
ncbi:unnamed protein product [Caenorhabditis brenneri]